MRSRSTATSMFATVYRELRAVARRRRRRALTAGRCGVGGGVAGVFTAGTGGACGCAREWSVVGIEKEARACFSVSDFAPLAVCIRLVRVQSWEGSNPVGIPRYRLSLARLSTWPVPT